MTAVRVPPVWNTSPIPGPGLTIGQLAARTAEAAVRALLREVEAGPKPGLVDRFGPGVHTDMDISHFRLSASVLRPYLESITLASASFMVKPEQASQHSQPGPYCHEGLAFRLRDLGLQAESAMLTATGGINTHKGAIWTMGLLCAAIGCLAGPRSRNSAGFLAASTPGSMSAVSRRTDAVPHPLDAETVCAMAARLAHAILHPGLATRPFRSSIKARASSSAEGTQPGTALTRGLAAKQAYGLRSARDEALDGFPSIRARALPLARRLRASPVSEDMKVISILLGVMCKADDTCLVARGGLPALHMAQADARQILDNGGPVSGTGRILYLKMMEDFRKDGLSPGGSADLCAAALFLAEMETGY